jgi:hypothetical protein
MDPDVHRITAGVPDGDRRRTPEPESRAGGAYRLVIMTDVASDSCLARATDGFQRKQSVDLPERRAAAWCTAWLGLPT